MIILETERLILSHLTTDDAPFILTLLNDPSFLRFIGDRGVRTVDDAREYILDGPIASYEQNGFGLWLVTLKESGESVGICGLVKRESLEDVDIGFAFLSQFTGRGYGLETAVATLTYAQTVLKLNRIVAITSLDNTRSIRLLENMGMRFEMKTRLAAEREELNLFALNF